MTNILCHTFLGEAYDLRKKKKLIKQHEYFEFQQDYIVKLKAHLPIYYYLQNKNIANYVFSTNYDD